MKSSTLFRIIFFGIVTIFVLNFVVVLVYFPLTPTSSNVVSPLTLKLESRGAFGNFRGKHQSLPKESTKETAKESITKSTLDLPKHHPCETYGCPVQPPELTNPSTNQTIRKALQNRPYSTENFPFCSETFATLSQQGASHKVNQDRGIFVQPFLPEFLSTTSFLVGIFDGHGEFGHRVAKEVFEKFPRILAEKLTLALRGIRPTDSKQQSVKFLVNETEYDAQDRAIRTALNETFLEVNEKGNSSNFYLGGCTASVSFRWGSKLYVANTGDSETIVVSAVPPQNSKQELWNAQVVYNTRRDKANQPPERARIESLGGKIHVNKQGFDPRVILHSEKAHDVVGLAMSRSIGDWEWKAVGVIAEPTIDVIDLSAKNETMFLLAASDGFWDMRQKPFYARRLAASFRKDGAEASLRPLQYLYDMIQKITPYGDDITVTIVSLE